jgi:hypothetical protein
MRTRVSTVTCPQCQTEIYSRARHDYHACYCGKTIVDGGFDYLRYGWAAGGPKPKVRIRYIAATRQELQDDWNARKDKFGFFSKGAK